MTKDFDDIFEHLFDAPPPKKTEEKKIKEKKMEEKKTENVKEEKEITEKIQEEVSRHVIDENEFVNQKAQIHTEYEFNEEDIEVKSDLQTGSFLRSIAIAIQNKRESLGMDRKEFGKYIGVKQKVVFKMENQDYDFTISELISLCNNLGIELTFNIN